MRVFGRGLILGGCCSAVSAGTARRAAPLLRAVRDRAWSWSTCWASRTAIAACSHSAR